MNWRHQAAKKLQAIKYHQCPKCNTTATLVVKFETNTMPEWDAQGNRQYVCPGCWDIFSIDANGQMLQADTW